jgi:hypothetical protein
VAQKLRTRSITAENLFTDAVEIVGHFNISITGTWVGTVTVQRAFDGGSTWFDVTTWTKNTQEYGFEPERVVHYRAGIKTGEFTSGQADVRLSQ